MSSLVRTRWSAVGAAIAVTLGAGGIITANAVGENSLTAPEPVDGVATP
jgi:hypothetical protein